MSLHTAKEVTNNEESTKIDVDNLFYSIRTNKLEEVKHIVESFERTGIPFESLKVNGSQFTSKEYSMTFRMGHWSCIEYLIEKKWFTKEEVLGMSFIESHDNLLCHFAKKYTKDYIELSNSDPLFFELKEMCN